MPVVIPDLPELFEEAYERVGGDMRDGYDLRSVRRSLNLLLLEWQNRGLNLFTIESGEISLVPGTATYVMPDDTIDLIEHMLREGTGENQIDTNMTRISVSTYAKQSLKNLTGRPNSVFIDRSSTTVSVTLWPVPSSNDQTFFYYRLKGIPGLTSGIGTTASIPPRFIPALVSGLAFQLSMKVRGGAQLAPSLKQEYEMQFRMASEEDQDNSTLYIAPMRTI